MEITNEDIRLNKIPKENKLSMWIILSNYSNLSESFRLSDNAYANSAEFEYNPNMTNEEIGAKIRELANAAAKYHDEEKWWI